MFFLSSNRPESRFVLPNVITASNLFMGFLSIIMSLQGETLKASWLILFAIVLDGLDGRAARKFNGFSNFGKELDSFADAVSFGVATAILLYTLLSPYFYLAISVSFIFMLSGILRLVRFNLETVASGVKQDFMGLPIPAAAGLLASYVIFVNSISMTPDYSTLAMFSLVASFLMLTRSRNMSVDRITRRPRLAIPLILAIVVYPQMTIFPFFGLYFLLSLASFAMERRAETAKAEERV